MILTGKVSPNITIEDGAAHFTATIHLSLAEAQMVEAGDQVIIDRMLDLAGMYPEYSTGPGGSFCHAPGYHIDPRVGNEWYRVAHISQYRGWDI